MRPVYASPALYLVLATLLGVCSSVHFAAGSKGTDTAPVIPGTSSDSVRKALGDPVREWRNSSGVMFRLYQFDGGRPAHGGYAVFAGLLAIGTLGLSEILLSKAVEEDERTGRTRTPVRRVVSYDLRDVVLGVFEEFDHLPEDGRNSPSR